MGPMIDSWGTPCVIISSSDRLSAKSSGLLAIGKVAFEPFKGLIWRPQITQFEETCFYKQMLW